MKHSAILSTSRSRSRAESAQSSKFNRAHAPGVAKIKKEVCAYKKCALIKKVRLITQVYGTVKYHAVLFYI